MYILSAHPALIEALDNSGKENLSIFQASNNSAQYRLLQNELIKNLELGKQTIVVIPDNEDSAIVPKLLANFKLARLSLILDDQKPLTDKMHAQIKALAKTNTSKYNPKLYELAKSRTHKKFSALKLHYSFLNQSIFGNRSWKFIAANNSYYSFHDEVCLLKQRLKNYFFEFNQDEYWIMRGRIEEASKLYRPDFDFSLKNDLLNDKTIEHENISDTLNSLNHFSEECRNLSRQFSLFTDTYSKQFYKKGLQEIQQISSVLDELREKLHNYEVRFGNTKDEQISNFQLRIKETFSSTYKDRTEARKLIRKQANHLIHLFKDSPKYEIELELRPEDEMQFSYIFEVISKAEERIDHWRNSVGKYKDDSLKQINTLNNKIENLKSMDSRLKDLIERINETKIFAQVLEDNTFNILKKIDYISELKGKIDQSIWLISNQPEYLKWKIYVAGLPENVHKMIGGLKVFKTSLWTLLFDRFYIEEVTIANFHPKMPNNYTEIQGYLTECHEYRQQMPLWIDYYWEKKRALSLTELQKNDKVLYNSLFKKSKPVDHSSFLLLNQHPEFIKSFYPVIIIKESLFEKLSIRQQLQWDILWIRNLNEFDTIDFKKLKESGRKYLFISNEKISRKDLKSLREITGKENLDIHMLNTDYSELVTPLKLMQKSERLSISKRIASMMSFANKKLRMFQLKETSILSFLSDLNNEKLVQMLDNQGIKELISKGKNEIGVADIIVDQGKKIVIITEDGLLDSSLLDSVEWQYNLLHGLKQIGINCINIWSSNYYYQDSDPLRNKLNKVIPIIESSDIEIS